MYLPSVRIINLLAAMSAVGLILFAILYLQNRLGLPPCPLCIFQRVGFMGVALITLVAALHGPGSRGLRVYGGLGLLASLAGAGVAVRHLWLQLGSADNFASCGPGLSFMMDNYPMADLLNAVFRGSGDCGAQHWTWLGVSIPGWSLVAFLGYAVLTGAQLIWGDVSARWNRRHTDRF